MVNTLARWNALVNNFTHEATAYWRNRERRLIALFLIKGGSFSEIAKVIDPNGPVTRQAVYLNHPVSEVNRVKDEIQKTLEEVHEA